MFNDEVKLEQIKEGDKLIADEGFTCLSAGLHTVEKSKEGLYINCSKGFHYLDGVGSEEFLSGFIYLDRLKALKNEILRMAEKRDASWDEENQVFTVLPVNLINDNKWSYPAYLMLLSSWNNALNWAER